MLASGGFLAVLVGPQTTTMNLQIFPDILTSIALSPSVGVGAARLENQS